MTERWPTRDLLTHRAATTPDRTALVASGTGETYTFRELERETERVAIQLERAGVPEGANVGVLLPTRPEFVVLVHAVQRQGATLVPLHPDRPAEALDEPLERASVDALVCGASTAETAAALTDTVETVVSIDETDAVPTLPGEPDSYNVFPYPWDDDSVAVVLFTSGTTGEPKGVELTRRNLLASAEASAYRLGTAPGDRWLCCLPMAHMGGLAPVFRTALYGTTLVVQRTFDPAGTASVIAATDVTGVSLVPTMLDRLLSNGWQPTERLDTVLLGGAPASADLVTRAQRRGVPVYPTYGTTETASQVATALPEQAFEHEGTVGQPLVNTKVRIIEDGAPVEAGDIGEIVVSGPTVSPGYLAEERTAAAFDEYGLHTGDRGYRDADGRLWVVGRLDDRIVTGGENVDPETVAAALRSHPDVTEAAVVGVPDSEWGERVAALVVGTAERGDLLEHCRERLADFEVPKTVAFADELPRTASGTVDRGAVVDRMTDFSA